MKLATARFDGATRVVRVDDAEGFARPLRARGAEIRTMLELIEGGAAAVQDAVADDERWPLDKVQFLAPIPRPRRNVFCVGKNYRAHALEFTRSGFDSSARTASDAIPGAPIVFTKVPECVIGPGDTIRYPGQATTQLDYEAELGVVVGKGGAFIAPEDAMAHVLGYTIINDVTARDRQARFKQWFLGKSLDTFCPMGPWITTADEFDVGSATVRCWVNGELRQNARTSDLIFDVPTLIATISEGLTLLPGDVIATGTPEGVGIGFDPPRFLQRGDVVSIEIDHLGRLENRVG